MRYSLLFSCIIAVCFVVALGEQSQNNEGAIDKPSRDTAIRENEGRRRHRGDNGEGRVRSRGERRRNRKERRQKKHKSCKRQAESDGISIDECRKKRKENRLKRRNNRFNEITPSF